MENLDYLFTNDPAPQAVKLAASHAGFAVTCMVVVVLLLGLQALIRWKRGAKLHVSTYVWGVAFLAALAGLHQLCAQGMVYAPAEIYGACCALAVVGGICCVLRDFLFDIQEAADNRGLQKTTTLSRAVRDALALLGASIMCMVAVELPWNKFVLPSHPLGVLVEGLMVLLALAFLYFAFMRHGAGPALGVVALLALGEAQYFVSQFRGSPLMPGDLLALETAASVSAGYTYELRAGALWAIAWVIGALCLMVFVQPRRVKGVRRAVRVLGSLVCALAVGLGAYAVFSQVDIEKDYDFPLYYWNPCDMYQSYCVGGLLPTFAAAVQDMSIDVPAGYTDKDAQQLEADLVAEGKRVLAQDEGYAQAAQQFADERPNVVVVMCETFADLSIFENLHAGYEGPEFFNRGFEDTLAKGPLSVSVIGGGTANSEFEFLTSTNMHAVGYGVYPYALYSLVDVPSLVKTFKDIGYPTTGVHPAIATNWHRDIAYPALGFDRLLDIDSFDGAPYIRDYVTDWATYDLVLKVLEEEDEPQFIFDLTIQNHAGYPEGGVPSERKVDYPINEPELADLKGRMLEYLSLIACSDDDLEFFISHLRELDEKVVLVFFGDHACGYAAEVNPVIFDEEDPDSLEHIQRPYESVYAVWANYPIAGRQDAQQSTDRLSASTLGNAAVQIFGGPFDEPMLAKLAIRQQIPVANLFGYQGANGQWYAWDDEDSPYVQAAHQLAELDYYNFGSRV